GTCTSAPYGQGRNPVSRSLCDRAALSPRARATPSPGRAPAVREELECALLGHDGRPGSADGADGPDGVSRDPDELRNLPVARLAASTASPTRTPQAAPPRTSSG